MNKKLSLETKIRDAAAKLSKAKAHESGVGHGAAAHPDEQLDAANKKVELAQKELWRVSERYNEVQRKLLEHRAGVLSRSVKTLERKSPAATDDTTTTSGSSTPNRSSQMSPITASSVTSVQTASSKGRFDGAHLFAGHSDALPVSPRTPARQMTNGGANAAANAELEEKLQAANAALEAAAAKHAETAHELEMLRAEKAQLEGAMGAELEGAQGAVAALQEQVARMGAMEEQLRALEGERGRWVEERAELERVRAAQGQEEADVRAREWEERQRQVEGMQKEIEVLTDQLKKVGGDALAKEAGQEAAEAREAAGKTKGRKSGDSTKSGNS